MSHDINKKIAQWNLPNTVEREGRKKEGYKINVIQGVNLFNKHRMHLWNYHNEWMIIKIV
jgi:hypothetical protein